MNQLELRSWAVRRFAWDQTAAIQAQILNVFRGEKQPAIHPDELNPFRRDPPPPNKGHELTVDTLHHVRNAVEVRNRQFNGLR